ncbi:MAG: hypothetical protein JWP06_173 [Candidatus Saccharibacteria bacterium]|nr:hypothetical protein [Candidatus Saccharibacteria bacterium]
MTRLPNPGSDNGIWGAILNDFLSQTHKTDGTLKDDIITGAAIADGAVSDVHLAADVQTQLDQIALLPLLTTTSQASTTYTLALADANTVVETTNTNPVTVTIPPNSSTAFPVGTTIELFQYGTGALIVAAGVGVTIRSTDGLLSARTQYSALSLRKRGTNEWVLAGDLA